MMVENKNNERLPLSFYLRDNVVTVAKDLLGKKLVSNINGLYTAGIITETEAYNGIIDKASHAYGDRRTNRTQTMYQQGGIAYIYLCYGIHSLFNVVTNIEGIPHAVLIRALKPLDGLQMMSERMGRNITLKDGKGPGKVTKLLGLSFKNDREDLINGTNAWLEDAGITYPEGKIISGPRIGVDYAQEDALLPYRYYVVTE